MFAETPARALLVVRLFAGCTLLAILVASSSVTASDSLPSCVTLEFGEDLPEGLDFSPDGNLLTVVALGGAPDQSSERLLPYLVSLWDAGSGKRQWRQRLEAPGPAKACRPKFSPDGKILAIAAPIMAAPGIVSLFDVPSGSVRMTLRLDTGVASDRMGSVNISLDTLTVAFSPDGKLVAGCGGVTPTATQVWNVSDGKLVSTMSSPRFLPIGFGSYVAFSPDGYLLVLPTLLQVELWDVRGGKLRGAIPLFADPGDLPRDGGMGSLPYRPWPIPLFSHDGKTLVAVRSDRQVFVIDVAAATTRQILKDFPNAFLAMHADSNRVVGCASRESRLKIALYNLETGKTETVLDRQVPSKKAVTNAALSQDGRFLATLERDEAWSDYVIHVWETSTGKQLAELKKPTARGRGRVHRDTRSAARMLSTRPGNRLTVGFLQGAGASHESGMKPEFVLSPDNRRLAVMGEDSVDLWDVTTATAPVQRPSAVPSPESQPSAPEPEHEAEPRIWTSADGRYSVEAQLVDVVGNVAVLRGMGGIEVKVPLEKLSKEDLEYIGQRGPGTLDGQEKKDR